MENKFKFNWEMINSESVGQDYMCSTFRAKVHGGWIVKVSYLHGLGVSIYEYVDHSLSFVPDPRHEWVISD